MGGSSDDNSGPQEPTFWTGFDPLAVLGGVAVPILTLCMMFALWSRLDARETRRQALLAASIPPPVKLDAVAYARGKQLYTMACLACHGAEGQGVAGLGKNLVRSQFTRELSDAQLIAFINAGRAQDDPLNTSNVPMPPKGGRPDFGDQNIADVVTFLRGMSDPRRAPAGPLPEVEVVIGDATSAEAVATAAPGAPVAAPVAAPPPTAAPMAAPVSAAQAVTFDPQAAARGKKAFISCMACHGKDGTGVKNMGKSLVNTPFVAKLDDAALVDFIKKGRGPTDPENTTKIAMPPKGGNPALKDEQIRDIVAYIRSLNGATPGTVASAAASATPAPATPAVTSATFAKIAAPIAPAEAKAPAGPPVTVTSAAPAPPASVTASAASRSHSTAVAAGDPVARGKKAYISCIACHGKDATGVKNMGKDLVNSPLVARLDDQALTDFIKKGRGPTDPENTTKIAMPPKGGNPALKDEQIKDIVAYLRSLRQSARTE